MPSYEINSPVSFYSKGLWCVKLLLYYYRYSALGPVWAETRAQSVDWYSSGTLHPGQVLRGSLQTTPKMWNTSTKLWGILYTNSYLFVCLLFIYLFIYSFIYLFIYLFILLVIHSFIYLFTHLFICLFIYSFSYLFIYLFVYLCIYLFVSLFLFINLFIYLLIRIKF